MRLLVVEDEARITEALRVALSCAGFAVERLPPWLTPARRFLSPPTTPSSSILGCRMAMGWIF
jgi:hypothetical protein